MLEEKCLLLAVRDRLRAVCGYSEQQCEIEFDELSPATVGDLYVVVETGGFQRGPHQDKSGTVRDYVYSVKVTVIKRARQVPRDRKREIFLGNLESLGSEIDRIAAAIDWQWAVVQAANEYLADEGDTRQGFMHALVFQNADQKPREVNPDLFAALPGKQAAGLARSIWFGAARRIKTVNVVEV